MHGKRARLCWNFSWASPTVGPELQFRPVAAFAECARARRRLMKTPVQEAWAAPDAAIVNYARAYCAFCDVVAQSGCALCILHRALETRPLKT
jgi:hypothetical protein